MKAVDVTTQGFNLPTQGLTPTLESAVRIARRANLRPTELKGRLFSIGISLAIGLAGTAGALVAIWAGLPQSEPARLLTAFILLGSLALTVAGVLGLFLVVWIAYIYEHVQVLEARAREAEATEATARVGLDPHFGLDVTQLVLTELSGEFEARHRNLGLREGEKAEIAAKISVKQTFLEKLSNLLYESLVGHSGRIPNNGFSDAVGASGPEIRTQGASGLSQPNRNVR